MPFNSNKVPKKFASDNSNGGMRPLGIYEGIVKDATDSIQKMGRLSVWIPDFGGDEDNKKFWYIVGYATPFGGVTPVDVADRKGDAKHPVSDPNLNTQNSYGWWGVPPDIGNRVLVCFPGGNVAKGYWFACIYPQNMNHMVPAIGSGLTPEGKVEPTREYDKNDQTMTNYADPPRPRFDPLADGLATQGLETEFNKGIATTSARRESPSRVFGYSTPRGNSIHVDDGEQNDKGEISHELIRLRTRSGVGITIHETEGFVFIISKNGKSYLEVSDNGVNVYSEQHVSLRTTADYNIHSAGDVNIDAGGNLNIVATGHIAMGAGQQTYISAGSDLVMGSAGNSSINSGGTMLFTSSGVTGIGAGGNVIIDGAEIHDGEAPPTAPLPQAPERHDAPDGAGGVATGSTITSRMPHHQPFHDSEDDPSPAVSGDPNNAAPIPTKAQTKAYMKVMYDELRKLGWTDVAARQFIAQIGRENDFRAQYMFGSHTDASYGATNTGMISWEGSRRTALLSYMGSKGLLDSNGYIKPGDASIQAQLDFADQEMRESYPSSYAVVRNTSADYSQVELTLSNGYVKWDRAGTHIGPAGVQSALNKMTGYYAASKTATG